MIKRTVYKDDCPYWLHPLIGVAFESEKTHTNAVRTQTLDKSCQSD
jgi:hypothetical protein